MFILSNNKDLQHLLVIFIFKNNSDSESVKAVRFSGIFKEKFSPGMHVKESFQKDHQFNLHDFFN